MPNHETNTVVVVGKPENIQRFVDEAFTVPKPEDGEDVERLIDFQLIIPQPEILGRTVSPLQVVETQEEADQKNAEMNAKPNPFRRTGDEIRFVTEAQMRAWQKEYGATDWYAWNTANWGTKWGAYHHSHFSHGVYQPWAPEGEKAETYGRVDLRFDTAWSQPTPIFDENVKQDEGGFPDVEYGNPYESEFLSRNVTIEFEHWHAAVE